MVLQSAILCLALTIYFEARGEIDAGKFAVAQVVINRANERNTTICHEVFRPGQFSWTRTPYRIPPANNKSWVAALKIAKAALNKKPILRSTFFQQRQLKTKHTQHLHLEVIIGNHAFYRRQ